MKKLNCLVVEDEPLAAEIIADYIRQVPFLELSAIRSDALGAMEVLREKPIDVIFLDIHLPKLKGHEFLRSLEHPPAVIITTAYRDYAVDGYEWNVLDYLVKPISFTRFLSAVNKLEQKEIKPAAKTAHFFFNVGKKRVKIDPEEILYMESLKEYVRIVTGHKTIVTKIQLGELERLLDENKFLRIHRSFIVGINKVDAFTATEMEVSGQRLPIGRNYKQAVMSAFGKEV